MEVVKKERRETGEESTKEGGKGDGKSQEMM